jgi:hypothetical protein
VLSKLTPKDIEYLSGLLKNGLTLQEKREAAKIYYKRFSKEDIAKLTQIYRKYEGK